MGTSERAQAIPTVLIVDDDDGTREIFAQLLRLEGLHIRTAADGRSAIAAASDSAVDFALVDLRLPDMSGLDVIRQLKGSGVHWPLVIMTAFPDFETSYDAGMMGADGYVEGPLSPEELLLVVRMGLRRDLPVRIPRRAGESNQRTSIQEPLMGVPRRETVLRAFVRTVDAHLTDSIASLARRLNMSESRLRHVIGRPERIRNHRRLDRAALLLRTSMLRVSEIAYETGFHPASFDRAFGRRFGLTPREYRARHAAPGPFASVPPTDSAKR